MLNQSTPKSYHNWVIDREWVGLTVKSVKCKGLWCVIYQSLNVGIKMQMSNKLWGTCPKKKGAWSVQCLFRRAVLYVWEDYTCKLYSSKCAEKYRHFRHLILFVCKEGRECQLLTFKLQKFMHYYCLLIISF